MDANKPFLTYLRKYVTLTDAEYDQYIRPYIQIRTFGKKEFVTKIGEVENYFNFIVQGLVRKYYLKGKVEINTQISFEGHIIHCQESFHSQTPSEYAIKTIEPTTLISITYKDLETLYQQSQKMERLGRLIINHMSVFKDRWQMILIRSKPRDLFLYFVQKRPEMVQRVPQKYLASYLNIQAETFSRFKHLLRKERKTKSKD